MAQALEINNLPTPQEETWKYTNLPRAIPANLNTADENHDIEITVAKGEVVTAPREIIFTGEDGQHHKPRLNITVEQGGENIGGKLSRHEMHAEIQGENSECTFNGVNLLGADQHGDTTILIEHQAPHCASNQLYRTVLDDNARGVFQGKVHVHQIAQKTDGYQLSNALLLSEKAEMDTKPELEIYADDVLCSHGATTGQLDEEPKHNA